MNKTMRFRFWAALFVGAFIAVWPTGAQVAGDTGEPQHLREVDLHIDQATLHTQVAANETQREIGLMHVAKMGDNDGMIFLMPAVERVSFWMKDTLIPLSIAFIDRNGTILEIHDMKAMDTTTLKSDSTQVAYALETNLHWFALNGIKPGDHVSPAPTTLGKPEP
jgi:uncharacterized membrane protein (UPF0127 family)